MHERGYLLPSGALGNDEIACTVVFYPDRPEYRAALQGSLAYLATWIAWEKDDDKRGKDAADNWREAYEHTLECWRMGCFEQLTDDVADILLLLQQKKDCCDDSVTYGPSTEVETEIDPGVGDPPDFYGETAVTDWDDWLEHVCYNAHAYVDSLVFAAETLETYWTLSGFVLSAITPLLNILSFVGMTLPFPFGTAATLLANILASVTSSTFEDTADDLETARDDIVCSLLQGTGLADAVEDALGSGTDWSLFFSSVDYDSATAIIYEGGYGSEYLPSETKDDCTDCGYVQLEDDDLEVWVVNTYGGNLQWHSGTKTWTVDSGTPGSCKNIWVQFYTDDTRTTRKLVRVEYVSCDDNSTCAGAKHHRGYTGGLASLVYELDHPTLPDVSDGEIHEIYDTHNLSFSIEFKLYEP